MIPKELIQKATIELGDRANTVLWSTKESAEKHIAYASRNSIALPDHVVAYNKHVNETRWDATMITSDYQSQFGLFLAKLQNAKRVLEIGTYVGYSAMVWSHATGPDGLVTSLELFPEMAKVAQDALDANNVKNVEIIIGAATDTLRQINPITAYDLVFIDADKDNYPNYLSILLELSQPGAANRLLRPGALIIADNILRFGHVADPDLPTDYWPSPDVKEKELSALRRLNSEVVQNSRLETLIVPLWDGVNLIRLVD